MTIGPIKLQFEIKLADVGLPRSKNAAYSFKVCDSFFGNSLF